MKVLQHARKQAKTENDSAIERFLTGVERGFNKLLMVLVGVGVAAIGLLFRGLAG